MVGQLICSAHRHALHCNLYPERGARSSHAYPSQAVPQPYPFRVSHATCHSSTLAGTSLRRFNHTPSPAADLPKLPPHLQLQSTHKSNFHFPPLTQPHSARYQPLIPYASSSHPSPHRPRNHPSYHAEPGSFYPAQLRRKTQVVRPHCQTHCG